MSKNEPDITGRISGEAVAFLLPLNPKLLDVKLLAPGEVFELPCEARVLVLAADITARPDVAETAGSKGVNAFLVEGLTQGATLHGPLVLAAATAYKGPSLVEERESATRILRMTRDAAPVIYRANKQGKLRPHRLHHYGPVGKYWSERDETTRLRLIVTFLLLLLVAGLFIPFNHLAALFFIILFIVFGVVAFVTCQAYGRVDPKRGVDAEGFRQVVLLSPLAPVSRADEQSKIGWTVPMIREFTQENLSRYRDVRDADVSVPACWGRRAESSGYFLSAR